jgi:hypothetical protein
MIQESCAGQLASGKIPTTLLPLIERAFDIDITAYFVLRITRFLHYYRDVDIVRRWFDHARRAVLYLAGLRDSQSIPWARDFWADWKDVQGMNNRRYGPHFVFIVKAAVKEFNWMAAQLGEPTLPIDVNVEPLWNGQFYQDIMRNGSTDGRFHEDQMIAGLFNVCEPDRFESMLTVALSFEGKFGLPETEPFYPEDFGYRVGEYHNGGIWPWLSFADAAARIAQGFVDSGRDLLLRVATADILTFGDYCPNEFLHGITGQGGGHDIQGWNAAAMLPFSLLSDEPRNELKRYVEELRANTA